MTATTDAKTILDTASLVLGDVAAVFWTTAELLGWLNAAQLAMVILAPQTNAKSASVVLIPGVRQYLPADGILLIDIPYNTGATGTTVGGRINQVPREVMAKRLPNWTTAAANATAKHFMYNPVDPKSFYIYPAQPATPGYVELVYSAIPATIADAVAGTKITVGDQYQGALLDYVLYKAFRKDSEYGNQDAKSQGHYQLFLLAIGAGAQQSQQQAKQQPQTKGRTQ